jgi:hypothetical protein
MRGNYNNGRASCLPLIPILFLFLSVTIFLSGCASWVNELSSFFEKKPTAESTLLTMQDLNAAVVTAMKDGETDITLDIAATTEEIRTFTRNLSPFWGTPTEFHTLSQFDDIRLSDDPSAEPLDVLRVELSLSPSVNYYVYRKYQDAAFEIPVSETKAQAVSKIFPAVIDEIFGEKQTDSSDYERVLAVHDWLVANLTYDNSIQEISDENGTYGALVDRRTMCQGYAEALQLILLCATDIEVDMEIGEGNNGDGIWVGHAWNLVLMDGSWYQVDATFDDPVNNTEGQVNHYYFGQNDQIMQADHKWEADYWPPAESSDFLYYRTSGLYVKTMKKLQTVLTAQVKDRNPDSIEVAATGFSVKDSDLQFLFSANRNIKRIYRSIEKMGDTAIIRITPEYK